MYISCICRESNTSLLHFEKASYPLYHQGNYCLPCHIFRLGGKHEFCNYRPQRSCGKVIFSQVSVSHSVHRGGVSGRSPRQTPPPLGRHPLPWADTPPQCMLGYTPLPSACWDTPPCPVHAGIHPPAQCMLGYTPPPAATAAVGTHPTGMHSSCNRGF